MDGDLRNLTLRGHSNTILPVFGPFQHLLPSLLSAQFTLFSAVLAFIILMRAFVEKLWVDLHKHLHRVVNHTVDCSATVSRCGRGSQIIINLPVPMALGVLIQRREHNRQNDLHVVANEVTEVFIVPEIERSFRDLDEQLALLLGILHRSLDNKPGNAG